MTDLASAKSFGARNFRRSVGSCRTGRRGWPEGRPSLSSPVPRRPAKPNSAPSNRNDDQHPESGLARQTAQHGDFSPPNLRGENADCRRPPACIGRAVACRPSKRTGSRRRYGAVFARRQRSYNRLSNILIAQIFTAVLAPLEPSLKARRDESRA